MPIQKSLKNAMLTGAGLVAWGNNTPTQYADKQHQYFSAETRTFTQTRARYASDYVEAQVQGLDAENPFAWQTRMLRFADIVKPTAAIQRDFDDYKMLLFADRDIEYVTPGSKIVTMGSTWLVVNPMNVSGSDGSGVVRRCNAVWNFLDFYGNVLSEPLIVENQRANANDSDSQSSELISKGYFNVICQYNEYTRQIDTNTRMILGTGAYRVTGYADFDMEYTGDYTSVRTLSFTVRYEPPNDAIDDMQNHVAGGKTFAWEITVNGPGTMRVGQSADFSARSVRKGVAGECADIAGTTLYAPDTWKAAESTLLTDEKTAVSGATLFVGSAEANYLWSSSDESVIQITEDGKAAALSEGTALITATLSQNPVFSQSVSVEVTETQDGVFFTSTIPEKLSAFQSFAVRAAYFEDGAETQQALTWTVGGAEKSSYSCELAEDGRSAAISCFGYSETPLTITAQYENYGVTESVKLEGI